MLVLIASGAGPFTHHGLLECLSDEVELTRLTMFLEREHATSQGHPLQTNKMGDGLETCSVASGSRLDRLARHNPACITAARRKLDCESMKKAKEQLQRAITEGQCH
jgi:hypothetical protein